MSIYVDGNGQRETCFPKNFVHPATTKNKVFEFSHGEDRVNSKRNVNVMYLCGAGCTTEALCNEDIPYREISLIALFKHNDQERLNYVSILDIKSERGLEPHQQKINQYFLISIATSAVVHCG
jgi:hypothetical protein